MKLYYCKQQSEQWFRLRLGIPTASEFHKIVTPKGKMSTQATGYMNWLLAEWIFGAPLENPETRWMERGTNLEPQAVKAYEFERDLETQTVGFITTDDGSIGASPDRLVGDYGLLEIKCPAPQTHVGYMLTSRVDETYWPQVQGQLWVSERTWLDIQSYCPGFPTVIVRVERDEPYIKILAESLDYFVGMLMNNRAILSNRYGPFHGPGRPAASEDVTGFGITAEEIEALRERHFPERTQ